MWLVFRQCSLLVLKCVYGRHSVLCLSQCSIRTTELPCPMFAICEIVHKQQEQVSPGPLPTVELFVFSIWKHSHAPMAVWSLYLPEKVYMVSRVMTPYLNRLTLPSIHTKICCICGYWWQTPSLVKYLFSSFYAAPNNDILPRLEFDSHSCLFSTPHPPRFKEAASLLSWQL